MKPKYRIVTDDYAGFEVQIKRWWWPFWVQVFINSHPTLEQAEKYIENRKRIFISKVVKVYES